MTRVFIAPVSFGLGDLVVSLPAAQALIDEGRRQGDETWLVARSPSQALLAPRIAGLTGCVNEASVSASGSDDRFFDLRDHPLQRDFWWGSPAFADAFGSFNINEILSQICADLGIAADFSDPVPLDAHSRTELEGSVLLVTETDGPSKAWRSQRWATLARWLDDAGVEVRQVTRSHARPEMAATGIPEVVASTPGDAVDVLSSCRAVVGVDTGLTHIAVQQGTPTLTICRHGSVYMRPWSHCRVLRGAPCTSECAEAEAAYAYNDRVSLRDFEPQTWTCPSRTNCLQHAGVERAVALLQELL
ncbi:MAG: glycosyltransferase family 9 protein [Nitrososphaerales archaeon]